MYPLDPLRLNLTSKEIIWFVSFYEGIGPFVISQYDQYDKYIHTFYVFT